MSRTVVLALVLSSISGQASLAEAAPVGRESTDAERVESLYTEGAALYKAGKYRSAIEKFRGAYAIYPEPNLLFNIAKSHEALGNLENAIEAYSQCRDSENVDPEVKAKAEQKIAALGRALEVSRRTVEAPSSGRGRDGALRVESVPREESNLGMDVAKWGTAVAGIGLIAAGTTFFLLGNSDHRKIEDSKGADGLGSLTQVGAQDLADSGETKKTIGTVLGSVGLAAGVTSIVLFVLDARAKPSFRAGAVASETGAAVWMGGRF